MKNAGKKIIALLCVAALCMAGCSSNDSTVDSTESGTTGTDVSTTSTGIDIAVASAYSDKALDDSYDESDATKIALNQDSVTVSGSGAKVDGTTVTITEKGTYIVSGTLEDGQIVVNLTEDKNVQLVLDNANITCSDSAAILVSSVKNLYLTLADGSSNTIADGSTYNEESVADGINAAIYSKDDLIINGTGSLNVTGNYTDGITSKDDLQIISGNITVQAVDDAVVGKDSICVRDAILNLTAGGDTMKSSNAEDTSKGYVIIDNGSITLNAGDDAIHSETVLTINAGTIDVQSCVEGLESLNIVLNGGDINVVSSDDGINVSGGNDSTSTDSPMMGRGGGMDAAIDGTLYINGGNLSVDAKGDGLDSNGNIVMTGGCVVVSGPTDAGNGALDFAGTFELSGGTLLVSGTTGMVQVPSEDSSQVSMAVTFDDGIAAGSEITVTDESGNVLYSFTANKSSNMILVSGEELVEGATYTITAGSASTTATGGDTSIAGSGTGMQGGGMMPGNKGDMTMPEDDGTMTRPEDDGTMTRPEDDGTVTTPDNGAEI